MRNNNLAKNQAEIFLMGILEKDKISLPEWFAALENSYVHFPEKEVNGTMFDYFLVRGVSLIAKDIQESMAKEVQAEAERRKEEFSEKRKIEIERSWLEEKYSLIVRELGRDIEIKTSTISEVKEFIEQEISKFFAGSNMVIKPFKRFWDEYDLNQEIVRVVITVQRQLLRDR